MIFINIFFVLPLSFLKTNIFKSKKLNQTYDHSEIILFNSSFKSELNHLNNNNSGIDECNWKEQKIDINEFKEKNRNLKLLNTLKNSNISNNIKLNIINKYDLLDKYPSKYVFNLFAGGLLDDWDFFNLLN